MVVSRNDPVQGFLNSIHVVKSAFFPLETSIRKVAKDFEHSWPNINLKGGGEVVNGNDSYFSNQEALGQLNVKKRNDEDGGGCGGGGGDSQCVLNAQKRKGLSIKFPIKMLDGIFREKSGANETVSTRAESAERKRLKERYGVGAAEKEGKGDGACLNCLQFAVVWSLLVNGFVQAFPSPYKSRKRGAKKVSDEDNVCNDSQAEIHVSCGVKEIGSRGRVMGVHDENLKQKEDKSLSLECFIGFVFDQFTQNFQKLDVHMQESKHRTVDSACSTLPENTLDHLKALASIFEDKGADMNGFFGNLNFARVGGVPSTIIEVTPSDKEEIDAGDTNAGTQDASDRKSPQKLANGIFSIPLSNVERLKSTLSTVSLTELVELLPQLGRPSKDHPDKKKLFSVKDFFRYTEAEGRRFFEELDRDGDGQVTLEDLEIAMRKRKLPQRYACEFMQRTRSHLFSKSIGWKQFLSLMEQKEPTILRAYTSLCLSKSGTLQKSKILASLRNAGLPSNEDNTIAMLRFLKSDTEESISYGHFRNFMLLLPSDRLQEDPRSIWFEAAVPPPVEIPAGSVLKSALAGGLACALSTSLMHPVDTIKSQYHLFVTGEEGKKNGLSDLKITPWRHRIED